MSGRPVVADGGDVVRVLVVDDHAPFRLWAGKLLRAGGLHVVGEAATGAEAIELAASLRPDVVLLDVRLPDLDGFSVCEELHALGIPAVLCSTHQYAARGSALGFLPKERVSAAELLRFLG